MEPCGDAHGESGTCSLGGVFARWKLGGFGRRGSDRPHLVGYHRKTGSDTYRKPPAATDRRLLTGWPISRGECSQCSSGLGAASNRLSCVGGREKMAVVSSALPPGAPLGTCSGGEAQTRD